MISWIPFSSLISRVLGIDQWVTGAKCCPMSTVLPCCRWYGSCKKQPRFLRLSLNRPAQAYEWTLISPRARQGRHKSSANQTGHVRSRNRGFQKFGANFRENLRCIKITLPRAFCTLSFTETERSFTEWVGTIHRRSWDFAICSQTLGVKQNNRYILSLIYKSSQYKILGEYWTPQTYFELQSWVRRDFWRRTAGPISIIRLAGQYCYFTSLHCQNTLVPALDYLTCKRGTL